MRRFSDSNVLLPILLMLFVTPTLMTCSRTSDSGDNWQSRGVFIVPVDSFVTADTITTADTLIVEFWGGQMSNRPKYSHTDVVRDSFIVQLTAWAEAFKWVGDGPIPPTNDIVFYGYELELPPPFYLGEFVIIVNLPDSLALVDTVFVSL